MKKVVVFQPSGPLLTAEGDFPLGSINSKDFYEESPKLPINKLDFLKRKKQKSFDLKINRGLQEASLIQGQSQKPESLLNEDTLNFEENGKQIDPKPLLAESFDIELEQQNKNINDGKDFPKITITNYDEAQQNESFRNKHAKWNSFCMDEEVKESPLNQNCKSISELDQSISLYKDALRRVEKEKNRKFARNLSLDLKENKTQMLREKSAETSQKKLFAKLKKDVFKASERLKFNLKEHISYIQTLEIMHELGFIKFHNQNSSPNSVCFLEERSLLAKMWALLKDGEKSEMEVKIQIFINFLAGVLGIPFSFQNRNPAISEILYTNADENGCPTFHRGSEDPLNYKKIHKEFELFYRNHLAFSKREIREDLQKKDSNSFQISKKSQNLAMKHYQKILDNDENVKSMAYYDRMARFQAATQAKIIQKSVESTQKVLEKCPFKPILKKPLSSQPKHRKNASEEECHKKVPEIRKTEEIHNEKQLHECTFKPKITSNYKQKENTDEKLRKHQEKCIERLEKARIERSFVKNFKERGLPLKNEVLHDIGNLTVSKINPSLLRKYFGREENSRTESNLIGKNLETFASLPIKKLSPQKIKSEEGFYTRIIQKGYETLKGKPNTFITSESANQKPMLFLEINLGHGKIEKICVFEDSDPVRLAENFAQKYSSFFI